MQLIVNDRELISENQIETIHSVQDVNDQTILNFSINKSDKNKLKTAFIDVKKAFDLVSQLRLFFWLYKIFKPSEVNNFFLLRNQISY